MGLTRRNFLTKLATLPLIGALPFVKARAEPEPTGFSQRLITREMNSSGDIDIRELEKGQWYKVSADYKMTDRGAVLLDQNVRKIDGPNYKYRIGEHWPDGNG